MACLIQDTLYYQPDACHPFVGAKLTVTATVRSLWAKIGGVLRDVTTPFSIYADGNGAISFILPWPSESDPTSVQWQITFPDGATYAGPIPEGTTGPITLDALKNSPGWGVVSTPLAPVTTVQGPAGPAGPSKYPWGPWTQANLSLGGGGGSIQPIMLARSSQSNIQSAFFAPVPFDGFIDGIVVTVQSMNSTTLVALPSNMSFQLLDNNSTDILAGVGDPALLAGSTGGSVSLSAPVAVTAGTPLRMLIIDAGGGTPTLLGFSIYWRMRAS